MITIVPAPMPLSTIADTLIELRLREEGGWLKRKLVVAKMRMSTPPAQLRELKLIGNRLVVA